MHLFVYLECTDSDKKLSYLLLLARNWDREQYQQGRSNFGSGYTGENNSIHLEMLSTLVLCFITQSRSKSIILVLLPSFFKKDWKYASIFDLIDLIMTFLFSPRSLYIVVQMRIINNVDFVYTFWNTVNRFQGKLFKSVWFLMQKSCFCHHTENISNDLLWYVGNNSIWKKNSLRKMRFTVDHLLQSGKGILSRTEHGWYLSAPESLQSSQILLTKIWFWQWCYDFLPRWMFLCQF